MIRLVIGVMCVGRGLYKICKLALLNFFFLHNQLSNSSLIMPKQNGCRMCLSLFSKVVIFFSHEISPETPFAFFIVAVINIVIQLLCVKRKAVTLQTFVSRTHVAVQCDTVQCWLPSADRSSLSVYMWWQTHTKWTSSLSHSHWSLSETDKLRTALEDIQKAQLSIS